MDSSTRVALLTKGELIKLSDLSTEERVAVALYWLERAKPVLKYLAIFRPLSERMNTPYAPGGTQRETPEKATWFDEGISDRTRIAFVSRIEYNVIWPKETRRIFGDYRNPDRDLKERNLLLTEDGSFLIESVECKLIDGVGYKGRGHVEDVSRYTVGFISRPELVSLEEKSSFFYQAILLLADSLRKSGEQKVKHGRAFLSLADEAQRVLNSLVTY